SVFTSTGLIEYRSITRTGIFLAASASAAAMQLCSVTPAPISATLSLGLWRTTLEPPTLNVSAAPYNVGYAPRVVRMKTIPGVSAMIRVSFAVWLGSDGYRTVELWIARIEARSSRAIGDGPSC